MGQERRIHYRSSFITGNILQVLFLLHPILFCTHKHVNQAMTKIPRTSIKSNYNISLKETTNLYNVSLKAAAK
jgi:hypothetical protein